MVHKSKFVLVQMRFIWRIVLIVIGSTFVSSTKVIELSDRFIELRGESTWIIMFYAPWCGHCKKLEPIWNHVAQELYNTEIRVGRVDCTRFTAMATEFSIKGFPTIMYIKGDTHHLYRGERTKDEIVGFAWRMASEPVPHLDVDELHERIKDHSLFFLYAGPKKEDYLWETYYSQALDYRHFHFFYSSDISSANEVFNLNSTGYSIVLVYKESSHSIFPITEDLTDNLTNLNSSLSDWINNERFPTFVRYTHGNFPQLWKVNRYLAVVVCHESKVGTLDYDETEENSVDPYKFRELIETFIKSEKDKYHKHFQFGWTGSPDLANSIAMEKLPIPSFIVINTSAMIYFVPEQPSHLLTYDGIEIFLNSILNGTAQQYGGDSYPLRLFRTYYNAKTSLEEMWAGNPVLTAVLFGLPLGFLTLICYSIWCSDILDADEEADEISEKHAPHEKKE